MALRYIGQVNFIQGNQFSSLTCPDGKWSKKLSYNTVELVLGYNFEHDKQPSSLWLAVHYSLYTVLTSPKKDETAVYG